MRDMLHTPASLPPVHRHHDDRVRSHLMIATARNLPFVSDAARMLPTFASLHTALTASQAPDPPAL
jgi:hypothetical protein